MGPQRGEGKRIEEDEPIFITCKYNDRSKIILFQVIISLGPYHLISKNKGPIIQAYTRLSGIGPIIFWHGRNTDL